MSQSENSPPCDCGTCDNCCAQIEEEYAPVKVVRVCATGDPSEIINPDPSESNPKDDNTFDCITQAASVPPVGNTFSITVANSSIYAVNQWVEFFGLAGSSPYATYQITGNDTGSNTIELRNGVYDSIDMVYVDVDGNPPPATSIPNTSCFVVSDVIRQPEVKQFSADVLEVINTADEIGLDAVPLIDAPDDCLKMRFIGLPFEDCGGSPIPDEYLAKTTNSGTAFSNETIWIPVDVPAGIDVVNNQHYLPIFDNTGKILYLDLFSGLANNTAYNIVTTVGGVLTLEKAQEVQSWRLITQEELTTAAAPNPNETLAIGADPTSLNKSIAATVPSGATHAVIMFTISCDSAGIEFKVTDKDGRVVLVVSTPTGGAGDGVSATYQIVVPMNDINTSTSIDLDFTATDLATGLFTAATTIRLKAILEGFTTVNEFAG